MLNRLDLRGVALADLASALPRPADAGAGPFEAVREIIGAVRLRGDAALREFAAKFDGGAPEAFRVPNADLVSAWSQLAPSLREALELAHGSISAFHHKQRAEPDDHVHLGVRVKAVRQPVQRAGCYVPGGRAAYPSTVLMTVVPAKAAGVAEVCLCVPPGSDGQIADVTLGAAYLSGVDEVYAVGGAQAIAAMAYGTESIPAVDVIAGPGNVYVATAKQEVARDVGVAAAFAGPSEIVVIADESTPVDYAAIDLVVQAEHGPGGLAWLITADEGVADSVTNAVSRITKESPRRDDISATLSTGGYAVVVANNDAAMAVANAIAPEHLQIMVNDPADLVDQVRNAGAVFCGPLSPASIGDYVAGPSHVLPTNGTARFAGALRVDDFCKDIHVITVDATALRQVASAVATLAEAEGLSAHAESVRMRMRDL